jgi:hypothetical protein
MSLRRAAQLVGLIVAFAAPAANATGLPAASAAACTKATIGGKHVCLAAGQSCRTRYQRQYQRHGFSCRRRSGQYRLVRQAQSF